MKKSLLYLIPVVWAVGSAQGDVTLPPLISDNMLLQSSKAAIWGKADPGEKVTVKLGQTVGTATAGKDGRWRVQLNGLKPGVPGEMTVTGKNKLMVHNVAVGDVWVCSGQSNMEMTVAKGPWCGYGGALNADQEVAAANYPKIRMFIVPKKPSETPVEDLPGKWEVCTPENLPHWSATAYFFGRQLHQDLGTPIGLLHTSWGGTSAQAWTPSEALQADPDFKKTYYDPRQKEIADYPMLKEKFDKETLPAWEAAVAAAKAEGKPEPRKPRGPIPPNGAPTPGALFNGMIHGATPYAIKGAIWYQGESNAADYLRYRRLLPAMIDAWRTAWHQPNFPFYIVQLANFMSPSPEPVDSNWAGLREAQWFTAANHPHTGMAVAIDIGDEKNIHPANKQEVGRRLALAAEAKTYGKPIVSSGPAFDRAVFEGNSVKIFFKPGTAIGLATSDGQPVKSIAVAGEDKKFVWAEAKIVPSEVAPAKPVKGKKAKTATPSKEQILVVTAPPGIEKAVSVRYAWANNPAVNLVNQAGLPAVPFRTDDFPQVEPPKPAATPAPKPSPTATPVPAASPEASASPAASPAVK